MNHPQANCNAAEITARVFRVVVEGQLPERWLPLKLTEATRVTHAVMNRQLHAMLPSIADGTWARCQLLRSEIDGKEQWQVIGIARHEPDEFTLVNHLPLFLCEDEFIGHEMHLANVTIRHPALRAFLRRVFQDRLFARAFVKAPRSELFETEPYGVLEEAAIAALEIQKNPFLTKAQKELALVAVILQRPGRAWVAGAALEGTTPKGLTLKHRDIGWLAMNHPAIANRLLSVWSRLNNAYAPPALGNDGAIQAAVWMALPFRYGHQPLPESISETLV